MAFFPCDFGPHSHNGRNSLFYVGQLDGQESHRWRLRLCLGHCVDVQQHLAKFKVLPEERTISGADTRPADCLSCGQPLVERGLQLYVTAYPANDEREDYWASIHAGCAVPAYLKP
jgi:hypothetical protein